MRRTRDSLTATIICVCLWACGDDGAPRVEGDAGDVSSDTVQDVAPTDTEVDDVEPLETIAVETGSLSLRVNVDPFRFELRDARGAVVLESFSDPVEVPTDPAVNAYGPPAATWNQASYRERVSWGWDTFAGQDEPWTRFDVTRAAWLDQGIIRLRLGSSENQDLELSVALEAADNQLRVHMAVDDAHAAEFNRLGQSFRLAESEHFLGLGGRFTDVEHLGESLYVWVEESGLGLGEGYPPGPANPGPNGESMTSFPIPFVLSTMGYGLWLQTNARSAFHLGSHVHDLWRVEVAEPTLAYTVAVNADPLQSIADFTDDTGRPELPPEWSFGPRRRVDLDALVDEQPEWRALRELGVPTSIIEDSSFFLPTGQQIGLEGRRVEQFRALHQWGFKVVGHAAPFVSSSDARMASTFEEGRDQGYFVEAPTGGPYLVSVFAEVLQQAAAVDVTDPAAVAWFQDLLRSGLDLGYDGWRLDFGAYIPDDAVFSDGRSGLVLHNPFPVLVQEAVHQILERELPSDHALIVSSSYTGSAASSPLVWADDSNASFDRADGLPSVVRAGINLGISGLPFYGSDIGGSQYFNDPPPDREVYLRWTEFGALSPLMHDENVGVGRSDVEDRWNIWRDEETLQVYADYARLHTRLVPYLHSLALEAVETGAPMMRHMYLAHPDDAETVDIDDQYFLGRALMVAPVVTRGVRSRSVYFPRGTYIHWETGEVIEGPRRLTVDAPLESIPLFRVDGGVIPMLDARVETVVPEEHPDVIGPTDVAEWLDVLVVRSPGASSLTMADGTTLWVEVTDRVAAPISAGEDDLPFVLTVDQATDCDGCYLLREDEPATLWVTTPLGENIEVSGTGITLRVTNPPTRPRRVRWEVVLLPGPATSGSGRE